MDNLKNHILTNILSKDNMNNPNYPMLLEFLDTTNRYDEICTYVMRCGQYELLSRKINLTDTNVMKIMSSKFCVLKAIEYYTYLQNNHELAHECENYVR